MSGIGVFKFKQFEVNHQNVAMKVGTDGVLLGAWAASNGAGNCLDIGVGSGLCSLMMAQRFPDMNITGIDVVENAIIQSKGNFTASPWAQRLKAIHCSLQEYAPNKLFDTIICNPPFFEANETQTIVSDRSVARSQHTLSHEELVQRVSKLLSSAGLFSIIVPFQSKDIFRALAEQHSLYLHRYRAIQGHQNAPIKRVLLTFSNDYSEPITEPTLVIEKERHQYNEAFIDLVKSFYLKL